MCTGKMPLIAYNQEFISIIKSSSLSTIVLNSRDWSEIIWLPRNSHFKINLQIGLYPKNPLECIG